jgi:hypothetical protein
MSNFPLPLGRCMAAYFTWGKFNGPTPKRHRLWSNDENFLKLVAEKFGYMSRQEQSLCPMQCQNCPIVFGSMGGQTPCWGQESPTRITESSQRIRPMFSLFGVKSIVCKCYISSDFWSISQHIFSPFPERCLNMYIYIYVCVNFSKTKTKYVNIYLYCSST